MQLALSAVFGELSTMPLPKHPVTLTAEQIAELNGKLSTMRHDINNRLSLIVATVEVGRLKPEKMQNMAASLMDQPPKIAAALTQFSAEFERAMNITRP
jgi:hypothetical protein